jgi:uncharacterized low-complexity protein
VIDERVHAPVGDGPHEKMKGMPVERVREGRELPGAHMTGEEKDAFAATLRGVEIVGAIEQHDAIDALATIFRKLREFAGHPANLANHAANNFFALRDSAIGKCEPEIEQRGAAQRSAEGICGGGKSCPDEARRGPRQKSHSLESRPRG